MITTYHRPRTLDEALTLLTRPDTVPLGGGTLLSRPAADAIEVVDLQSLGLDTVKKSGSNLEIGATVTLQALLESEHTPEAMKTALKLEAPLNIRNSATVAGTLVACDGRSTFAVSLLALDAKVEIKAFEHRDLKDQSLRKTPNLNEQLINLGDFLPLRPRGLITSITIPLGTMNDSPVPGTRPASVRQRPAIVFQSPSSGSSMSSARLSSRIGVVPLTT